MSREVKTHQTLHVHRSTKLNRANISLLHLHICYASACEDLIRLRSTSCCRDTCVGSPPKMYLLASWELPKQLGRPGLEDFC